MSSSAQLRVQPVPMDRLAERFLTLIGVPLLTMCIGGVGAQMWSDHDANARRDVMLIALTENTKQIEARLRERVDASDTRARQELDALRTLINEATRRGESSRADLARAMSERDAELAKQIGDQATNAGQFRVQVGVLTEQVTGMRADLTEIKAFLLRPSRAVDRLPNGQWSPPR